MKVQATGNMMRLFISLSRPIVQSSRLERCYETEMHNVYLRCTRDGRISTLTSAARASALNLLGLTGYSWEERRRGTGHSDYRLLSWP